MTIGSAKERNGLYFVSNSPSRLDSCQTTLSLSTVSDSNVFLWHNRLGHPNFTYLKYLYPDLFINKTFHLSLVNIAFVQNNLALTILLILINHQNLST